MYFSWNMNGEPLYLYQMPVNWNVEILGISGVDFAGSWFLGAHQIREIYSC